MMNKSMITGTVLGVVIATAGGAAAYKYINAEEYAEVLDVKTVTRTLQTPREECRDEVVTHTRPVQDPHRITGTAIGAVLGGVVGNQIGGGSGKKVATVAGAAAGGYAGNKTQEKMQQGDTYTTIEQRCHTVMESQEKFSGYDVRYRYQGAENTVRMDYNPGSKIPVENGQLVLDKPAG